MTPLAWVLAVLATYRLTMLAGDDKITELPRAAAAVRLLARGRARLAEALGCPWCWSVWIAPPVVWSGLEWSTGWGWQLAAGALSASAVTGVLATYARPE